MSIISATMQIDIMSDHQRQRAISLVEEGHHDNINSFSPRHTTNNRRPPTSTSSKANSGIIKRPRSNLDLHDNHDSNRNRSQEPYFNNTPGDYYDDKYNSDSSDHDYKDVEDSDGDDDDALQRHIHHRATQTAQVINYGIAVLLLLFAISWMTGGSLTLTNLVPSSASSLMSPFSSILPDYGVVSLLDKVLGKDSSQRRHHPNIEGEQDIYRDESAEQEDIVLPDFVYEHPYVSSSYYTSTKSLNTLLATEEHQVMRNLRREAEEAARMAGRRTTTSNFLGGENNNEDGENMIQTRLAIVRPFCEFDAEDLPTTFTCWNALPPCKAASDDIGEDGDEEGSSEAGDEVFEISNSGELLAYKNTTQGRHLFDLVGSNTMKSARADVFLFYSQTFSENEVAIKAVDTIIDQFFEPGGWSQCFDNIYAIEANIPRELDLYIPSAQEELYNWVNGPNRQFEAAFRVIQSGEWGGEYDGFYLMEGDSVPIKAHWLDVLMSEIEVNRPFAILGAQYDGDKWDNFYEKIPISLLHHTNGNAIYNTSHPLLERLVGQLEVEAPCPYNSIPYDYRMGQMWVEGTLGIVPELAPKIMLNEEGENITLSNNLGMFSKWADIWERENPFKYTPAIHNYAATNLIPRHLGPEYITHGAKLYSPWNPIKSDVTLVVSEWFFDRSLHLVKALDEKDHPFSEVVIMVPPVSLAHDDYHEFTDVPVRTQHRAAPDYMDLCEAEITTDWFMITNSYHSVAKHVDLMFTPGTFKPVIPFTPATYAFCFKFPYCKETVNLAQRISPGIDKIVQDMDMLYNTKARNAFCEEWKAENGEEGEDLYKHQQRRLIFRKKIIGPSGPTGTSYFGWLVKNSKDGLYKMTDRSLYGARPPFVKIFIKEEKLDGMSEDESAKRVGMTLLDNSTDCNCGAFETEIDCAESGIGCIWRPLFESCHPPELIDGSEPICTTTEAPTMAPTQSLPLDDTDAPTSSPSAMKETQATEKDAWYTSMFKSREHEDFATTETDSTEDTTLLNDDDAVTDESSTSSQGSRKLEVDAQDPWYETDLSASQRMGSSFDEGVNTTKDPMDILDTDNMLLVGQMPDEELQLEALLEFESLLINQAAQKKQKRNIIQMKMQQEEMRQQAEILRLEEELEEMEQAQASDSEVVDGESEGEF